MHSSFPLKCLIFILFSMLGAQWISYLRFHACPKNLQNSQSLFLKIWPLSHFLYYLLLTTQQDGYWTFRSSLRASDPVFYYSHLCRGQVAFYFIYLNVVFASLILHPLSLICSWMYLLNFYFHLLNFRFPKFSFHSRLAICIASSSVLTVSSLLRLLWKVHTSHRLFMRSHWHPFR